jgi:hypothetical protein
MEYVFASLGDPAPASLWQNQHWRDNIGLPIDEQQDAIIESIIINDDVGLLKLIGRSPDITPANAYLRVILSIVLRHKRNLQWDIGAKNAIALDAINPAYIHEGKRHGIFKQSYDLYRALFAAHKYQLAFHMIKDTKISLSGTYWIDVQDARERGVDPRYIAYFLRDQPLCANCNHDLNGPPMNWYELAMEHIQWLFPTSVQVPRLFTGKMPLPVRRYFSISLQKQYFMLILATCRDEIMHLKPLPTFDMRRASIDDFHHHQRTLLYGDLLRIATQLPMELIWLIALWQVRLCDERHQPTRTQQAITNDDMKWL